jgi:hypothetical protein
MVGERTMEFLSQLNAVVGLSPRAKVSCRPRSVGLICPLASVSNI